MTHPCHPPPNEIKPHLCIMLLNNPIRVFPKIMVPPNHPFVHRVFHCKPSILGYHYFWKHPSNQEQTKNLERWWDPTDPTDPLSSPFGWNNFDPGEALGNTKAWMENPPIFPWKSNHGYGGWKFFPMVRFSPNPWLDFPLIKCIILLRFVVFVMF